IESANGGRSSGSADEGEAEPDRFVPGSLEGDPMQQFDNSHFTRPSADRSTDLESALEEAMRELHRESAPHRLQVASQRLRDQKRRGNDTRLAYDEALAWLEKIESEV